MAPPLAGFGVVGPDTRHNDEMVLLRGLAELGGRRARQSRVALVVTARRPRTTDRALCGCLDHGVRDA